jgi:cytochrome c553
MKMRIVIAVGLAAGLSALASAQAASVDKPDKVAVCAACHGETGASQGPTFPKLAGQQPSYIEHALHAYQSGERKNAVMAPQAAALADADIKALALWYSSQPAKVYVPDIEQNLAAGK